MYLHLANSLNLCEYINVYACVYQHNFCKPIAYNNFYTQLYKHTYIHMYVCKCIPTYIDI